VHQNKFDEYSTGNLILPLGNNYLQNPEYFYFKSKREAFRSMNVLNTLHSLNIESQPFFPISKKKLKTNDKKLDPVKEGPILINEVNEKESPNKKEEYFLKPITHPTLNNNISKENKKQTSTSTINPFEDNMYDRTTEMIKSMNLTEIKEFIPKHFKIVAKEKTN
jgi:hypothetical protein